MQDEEKPRRPRQPPVEVEPDVPEEMPEKERTADREKRQNDDVERE